MKIKVNNRETEVREGAAVAELIDPERFTGNVAVALNDRFVPRGTWATTALAEGDDVVIITAAYGG